MLPGLLVIAVSAAHETVASWTLGMCNVTPTPPRQTQSSARCQSRQPVPNGTTTCTNLCERVKNRTDFRKSCSSKPARVGASTFLAPSCELAETLEEEILQSDDRASNSFLMPVDVYTILRTQQLFCNTILKELFVL